jgi:hypothetical protein
VNTLPWVLVAVLIGIVGWLLLALSGASRTITDLRSGSRWPPGRDDGTVHVAAGLPPGTLAPAFEGTGLDRTAIRSSDLTGSRHLLVFVDPDCAACDVLVPELIGASDRREAPRTVFVSRGAPEEHPSGWVGGHRSSMLIEADDAISSAYAVEVTPTAFVIDEGGAIVASGAFATLDDLLVMVAETDGVRVVPSTEASA